MRTEQKTILRMDKCGPTSTVAVMRARSHSSMHLQNAQQSLIKLAFLLRLWRHGWMADGSPLLSLVTCGHVTNCKVTLAFQ